MNRSTPGLPVHHQLPEFTQIHVLRVSDAIQPSHPLLSPSPPAFNLSQHRVFSSESILCIRWPKDWNFRFSISPSNEYSGLIYFRIDCLDLLAVRGTLKSIIQHHSSKASILWRSVFFIVQLSHPYMTTGKMTTLTRQTFVCKIMVLLYNTVSRFIIACLPRNKRLLISWLQSPSAVILVGASLLTIHLTIWTNPQINPQYSLVLSLKPCPIQPIPLAILISWAWLTSYQF